jgi:hypothetical protein
MGGFAADINDPADPFIPGKPTPVRVVLTSHGVQLLADCGLLPDISEDFIKDKSKADSLAKLLVCVQAIWCLLQYIGRLVNHLPVSLLEVNTLGHAMCALAIYMSWWYKPLDIKEPYVLSGEWVPRLCAYMWLDEEKAVDDLTGHSLEAGSQSTALVQGVVHPGLTSAVIQGSLGGSN